MIPTGPLCHCLFFDSLLVVLVLAIYDCSGLLSTRSSIVVLVCVMPRPLACQTEWKENACDVKQECQSVGFHNVASTYSALEYALTHDCSPTIGIVKYVQRC
jgi:hypothetical protein